MALPACTLAMGGTAMTSETEATAAVATDRLAMAPDAPASDGLPRDTTPTWEVELLISGVAVFAMLQLAGWLGDQLFALLPRITTGMQAPIEMFFIYAKSASAILAATFVLHLMLRAHWIALVGMHSVFPSGIRWDRLRSGPVQIAVDRKRLGSPAEQIERADNRATIVFGIGVQLATALLMVSLVIGTLFVAVMATLWLLGRHPDPTTVFSRCALAFLVPFLLAPLIDRWFGGRLREGSFAYRLLATFFRAYAVVGLSRHASVVALASSHAGRRRVNLAVAVLMMVAVSSVIFSVRVQHDPTRLGAYALFPDTDRLPGRVVDDAHYDDRRAALRDAALPFVQSAVVIGPYLRLTVPYRPGHDDAAQQAACPHAVAAPASEAAAGALLDCLQSLHPILLDGKAIPGLSFEAGSDPRTDRPALLAMIDVRMLPPGRHELKVGHRFIPAPGHDSGKVSARPDPWEWDRIPFWR